MIAMWLIPFGLSIKFAYYRFIVIWICFTLITMYITRRATRQPIEPNTPRWERDSKFKFDLWTRLIWFRLAYKWFLLVYKVSYGLAIFGYFLVMMTFLGINNLLLIQPQVEIVEWETKLLLFLFSDSVGFRNFDYVLWNLLWSFRKRYGWVVYRSYGIENRSMRNRQVLFLIDRWLFSIIRKVVCRNVR